MDVHVLYQVSCDVSINEQVLQTLPCLGPCLASCVKPWMSLNSYNVAISHLCVTWVRMHNLFVGCIAIGSYNMGDIGR